MTAAPFKIMPMPAHTNRLHLDHGMDQWLGDSKAAIDHAAKMSIGADGGRFVDINLQRVGDALEDVEDTAYGLHSTTARANGFKFIVNANGIGRRHMTDEELDRHVSRWAPKDVDRWRRTLKWSAKSYESRVKPERWSTLLKYGKKKRVIPCFELKSTSFTDRVFARRMAAYVKNTARANVYFMALVNMKFCRAKGDAFVAAGLPFAVLAHNEPKPKDYADWPRTRTWGVFR